MAEFGQVFYCNYCQTDVSYLRVKCAVCADFDLCLQLSSDVQCCQLKRECSGRSAIKPDFAILTDECFASGAEMGEHRRTHGYQLVHYGSEPLFPSQREWVGREELELLNKVVYYGYWKVVAESMRSKSAAEIEEHFNKMYVEGNIGKVTLSLVTPPEIMDFTKNWKDTDSPEIISSDLSKEICEELGYMPLRDEFKEEYDNDAEAELHELLQGFDYSDDDELYTALRLACVDIYQNQLRKRHRIKKLIKDYDLIKKYETRFKVPQTKLEKEESAVREKLKAFCRLMSSSKHEAVVKSFVEEQKLKSTVKELQAKITERWISKGSKTGIVRTDIPKGKLKENKHRKVPLSSSIPTQKQGSIKKELKHDSGSSSPSRKKRYGSYDSRENAFASSINLLSRAERKLCSDIGMEPSCYIAVKTSFLKDRNVMKESSSVRPSIVFPREMNDKVQKVANFMVNNGWITAG